MALLRIADVSATGEFNLSLVLSNGSVVERNVEALLRGPVFEPLRADPKLFKQARAEGGTVVWPNGADLCPDVLIWGGPPPEDPAVPQQSLTVSSGVA